ncbi:hypothetical protein [Desulfocastanea catecholica]
MNKTDDRYSIVRRIDWIKNNLLSGQLFNCSDLAAKFDISTRTAHRDICFVRAEYFKTILKYNTADRSYYLEPKQEEAVDGR